jgi:hypothetical protein
MSQGIASEAGNGFSIVVASASPCSTPPATSSDRENCQQASVLWQVEGLDPMTFAKFLTVVRLARGFVSDHHPALVPSGTLDSGNASTGVIPSA